MMAKSRSLDFRRDVRSVEDFKKDIQHKTSVEKILLSHWIKEMSHRGHKVEVENYGIDNTGKFVPLSDNRPDFELNINGTPFLYEVKQNSYTHRNSFKVYDLQKYIELEARILLFYGVGTNGEIYHDSRWAIIQPSAMKEMLRLTPTKSDVKWGNKNIVVIYKENFHKYFKSFEFKHL